MALINKVPFLPTRIPVHGDVTERKDNVKYVIRTTGLIC